ncbi:MAG: glycosyltransferase family 2 protein [Verrucomicrobiota bacterium]
MSNENLAIITPVKDELPNLPGLIRSVTTQSKPPALWMIVEDGSTDGSREFLAEQLPRMQNIDRVVLVRTSGLSRQYQLGTKYASVIATGLAALREFEQQHQFHCDFVGILDADCTLAPDYYARLIEKFRQLPRLGIASGILHYRTDMGLIYDRLPMRWARGAVRVWRAECLEQAAYSVAKSADAISSARAWTKGWSSQAFVDSHAETREMSVRVDPRYSGASAYYFYMPFYYLIGKCLVICLREGRQAAWDFYRGYVDEARSGSRIKAEPEVIAYFQWLIWRNIYERLVVLRNLLALQRQSRKQRSQFHQAQRSDPKPAQPGRMLPAVK